MPERTRCPVCEEGTLRRIIYGFVDDPDVIEKAYREELVRGGCMICEDFPDWECLERGEQRRDAERRWT